MNKKGFTFVELIYVMVFIGILVLIVFPAITSLTKQSEENKYKAFLNDVFLATEAYVQKYSDNYPNLRRDNGKAYVYMSELVSSKLLKSTLINPNYCKDGICESKKINICDENSENCHIDDYTIIVTSIEDGGYKYELVNEIITGEYKEMLLNGADPVVSGDLIPVTIANDGKVTKANIHKKWYCYEDKLWANAVILTDEGKVEDDGTILESSIESYFVWIPRYRYELFAPENYSEVINEKPISSIAKTINIEFESKEVSASDGSNNWLTHPAFTTFNTNGIWVGKFETGYKDATSTAEAQTNTNISDDSKVIIKPNVYSWRGINVSNIFTTSLTYNTNLNSHMMKNTEWGAVAYLSHSKYGINKEVNINNNNSYLTGYSSTDTANQSIYPGTYGTNENVTLPYNTSTGYKASTTGNISGIYDMSGGAWEYMAAYIDGIFEVSGFDESSIEQYDSKYFDIYPTESTDTSYSNRILGDATGELGPFYFYQDGDTNNRYHNNWYFDNSYFINISSPWFYRSGGYNTGVLASQFLFSKYNGGAYSFNGFRIVLAY